MVGEGFAASDSCAYDQGQRFCCASGACCGTCNGILRSVCLRELWKSDFKSRLVNGLAVQKVGHIFPVSPAKLDFVLALKGVSRQIRDLEGLLLNI